LSVIARSSFADSWCREAKYWHLFHISYSGPLKFLSDKMSVNIYFKRGSMIKVLCLIIVLGFSSQTAFASKRSVSSGRKDASFFYSELVPNESLVFTFQSDKYCQIEGQDKIIIDEFDSSKGYPSTESSKTVPVRIINLYVQAFSICSNQPKGKFSQKLVVGPFGKMMTHIRLTVLDGVKITVGNSCGKNKGVLNA